MQPSKVYIPFLREKLDYMRVKLGIHQKFIAFQLKIGTDTISHWKDDNSIPKPRISPLCKCLGIGIEELKTPTLDEFYNAVQSRFNKTVGTRWKIFVQQCSLMGALDFDVISSSSKAGSGLKGVYITPKLTRIPSGIKRLTLNDRVRFNISLAQATPEHHELKALLLIIENPVEIQLMTTEKQEPDEFKIDGNYSLPNQNSPPFYLGEPIGKHSAYLISLAVVPPDDLYQKFAEKPDGYAADVLTQWMLDEHIAYKINLLDFIVNA